MLGISSHVGYAGHSPEAVPTNPLMPHSPTGSQSHAILAASSPPTTRYPSSHANVHSGFAKAAPPTQLARAVVPDASTEMPGHTISSHVGYSGHAPVSWSHVRWVVKNTRSE